MKEQKVVYIDKDIHSKMKVLAAVNKVTLSQLIEKALEFYMRKNGS